MKVINDSALSYIWTKLKNHFQDKLISGTNIKTINNNSLLGSGDITISGGGATNWQNGSATGSVRTSGSREEYSGYTIGTYAVAEGRYTKAIGSSSHAEGYYATASGNYSHAEGASSTASAQASHAEGNYTEASYSASHAEGDHTVASDYCSHAEGGYTTASGSYSHAEGNNTTASGDYSHAEGYTTTASGDYSHAGGYGTTARRKSQTTIGEYNVFDPSGSTSTRGDYAFIIGNGTSSSARSNAYAVEWDGDSTQAGRATTKDMTSAEIATFISGLGGIGSLLFDAIYPVGSYYETSNTNFDPNTEWGGTWEKLDEGLFLQATEDSSKVGDSVAAGLPNITGEFSAMTYGEGNFVNGASGAFYAGSNYQYKGGSTAYWSSNSKGPKFDASKSNSIYGKSTTVQPPAKLVYIWHRTA